MGISPLHVINSLFAKDSALFDFARQLGQESIQSLLHRLRHKLWMELLQVLSSADI